MKLEEATHRLKVAYKHFDGTLEYGRISSHNQKYIFVKFDKQLDKFGWEGTTSQSCDPEDLIVITKGDKDA